MNFDWDEWGDAAFDRARQEKKAVLLWISYRGCRACGRMEEESFADAEIAAKIREDFVAIRVDRDERPDIDRHFQRLFSVMLGKEEGWPLTFFLTPDKTPLYAAAYVPPEARDGMMGMGTLLDLVAQKYADDPEGFAQKGREALAQLALPTRIEATHIDIKALSTILRRQILDVYDPEFGGYGDAPKELHPALYRAALRLDTLEGEVEPLHSLRHTLDTMLDAPIWDAEAKGFFCCTLDREWQIPQQHKRLAENAIMVSVLLDTADKIGNEGQRYVDAAYGICDWALEQMRDGQSGLWINGITDGERDERIFAAPNALMTRALLDAARREERYRPEALGALNRLMEMMVSNMQVRHQLDRPDTVTYLVDYAALASAWLAAYDLTGNRQFIATAGEYAGAAIRRFYDRGRWAVGDGEWNDPMVFVDVMLPSAAATITMVLTRLADLLDHDYRPFVDQTLAVASYQLMRRPISKAGMAEAAMRAVGGVNGE